jgi:hypothetical protein
MVRLFGRSSAGKIKPIPLPSANDEKTYTRRQRLKRTISSHTLTLIQTWFDILPKDNDGKVLVTLLLQRMEDVGLHDLMTEKLWNPDDRVTLDTFLDLMAKSGLVENYRELRGNFNQFNLATPLINPDSFRDDSPPPIRYRTASVMDMLRDSVGGGVRRAGGVKVHPRQAIISRKETPPLYSEKFSRIRRVTKAKVMAFLR